MPPERFVPVLGSVGTICFASLLAPQVLLNARRRSTAGLELSLVVLWHVASIVYGASLLAEEASIWLLLSMGSFCALSAVLEGQEAAYARSSRVPIVVWAAGLTVASVVAVVLLAVPLRSAPAAIEHVIGEGIPASLFAAGFAPQLHTFMRTKSLEGYSFGVTLLDVVGSAANCGVLLLSPTRANAPSFFVSALPFLVIIALHGVLISVALHITFGLPKRAPPDDDPAHARADGNSPAAKGGFAGTLLISDASPASNTHEFQFHGREP
ncbi:hypothetical protein KFE25_007597 [Diacronema lutheri]|uniref:Uncharacterized protein n=1 Tax=Diacronema lutheri TaxID=2081491 RepID=A0A8J5XRG4_DIALT|nr:hypothetical protein KFE25_007597 [Diacronema lutheri]